MAVVVAVAAHLSPSSASAHAVPNLHMAVSCCHGNVASLLPAANEEGGVV